MDSTSRFDALVALGQFQRPAKEILLDLVHVFLDYEIPLNKIEFFKAAALDQRPEIATDPDTFVAAEIDPDYDYRFPGDNGFLYRRIDLSMLAANEAMVVKTPLFPFTTAELMLQINMQLGTTLTLDDVVQEVYEEGTTELVLKAHPNSWCWQGERALVADFTGTLAPYLRITTAGQPRITSTGAYRVTKK